MRVPSRWQDLEVERAHDGRPSLRLWASLLNWRPNTDPFAIELSLSHSDRTAGAVAVLVRGKRER